jgi:hypothetical protein
LNPGVQDQPKQQRYPSLIKAERERRGEEERREERRLSFPRISSSFPHPP